MLKLKLQYFDYLIQTVDSLKKSLMLGKIEGRRRRGCQRMRWLNGLTDAMGMNLGKLWEMVRVQRGLVCCSPWGHKQSDTTEWLNNKLLPNYLHGTGQWWIWKQSLEYTEVQESLRIFFKNFLEPWVTIVKKGLLQVWFHSNVWRSALCWQKIPGRM